MRFILPMIATLLSPTIAFAHDYKVGDLLVNHPVAKTTPSTAMAGAAYLTIVNEGDTADQLIAVEADFPRVEIHDIKVENDIASMFQIEGVEIPAGETVVLRPGGKHVMFMGLDGDPFEEGETIDATLIFANAGRLEMTFNVETLEQITEALGTAMDHGSMDHSHN